MSNRIAILIGDRRSTFKAVKQSRPWHRRALRYAAHAQQRYVEQPTGSRGFQRCLGANRTYPWVIKRHVAVASSAWQNYLTYRTKSLRRRTLLPCAVSGITRSPGTGGVSRRCPIGAAPCANPTSAASTTASPTGSSPTSSAAWIDRLRSVLWPAGSTFPLGI